MTEMLSFLEKHGGGILAGAFFLLMGYIFYWLIVIVPRRTREIYSQLQMRGYSLSSVDDAPIAQLLSRYAAIYPKDPVIDADVPSWQVRRAALRDQWGQKRVIVNVMRGQRSSPGVKYNYSTCTATILVEQRPLPVGADVHLVPARNRGSIRWKKRYGLEPVPPGSDPALLTHYEVYAAPGASATLPAGLVKALIQMRPLIENQSLFCFQHGVSLRLQPEGWGITTSNEIYKQQDMELLLEMADGIAEALK